MKKQTSLRWILFSVALITILGITILNVFYLYRLQENSQSIQIEKRKSEISDFAENIRDIYISMPYTIWDLDLNALEKSVKEDQKLTNEMVQVVDSISQSPLYKDIYFTFPGTALSGTDSVQIFNRATHRFEFVDSLPEVIADGINLTKARMKILIDDYRWNTKTIFDTHRSMNITIINKENKSIIGYLTLLIDYPYLLTEIIEPELVKTFGSDSTGTTIWIVDWVKGEVLATNNKTIDYNRELVNYFDKFPGMFENWNIYASVSSPIALSTISDELTRNIIVLSIALIMALGSILYILITAQKEREFAIRQSAFLSNVTHELKTPLAVIQAAGENLKDGRVKDPQRLSNYGKHIYDESQRLKKMIEKLLDVARSDANKISIKAKPHQLESLVQLYLDEHLPYYKTLGFSLHINSGDENDLVLIDSDHFETIISNLLENAIKYSHESKDVYITIYSDKKQKIIEIKDAGIGIPSHAITHIFDKFYRVEDTLTAQTKGHGLGLSIVKYLVEINGGEITVDSIYKKGSVFTLKFPILVDQNSVAEQLHLSQKNKEYVIQG